jgi:hypothetical protein
MNSQCGYRGLGHYCTEGKVQFISRYRGENDYCVDGRRVQVSDSGEVGHAQAGDLERIYAFEWAKYQEYLQWTKTCGFPVQIVPFDAGVKIAMEHANYRAMELDHCLDCGEPYDLLPCNARHARIQEDRARVRPSLAVSLNAVLKSARRP